MRDGVYEFELIDNGQLKRFRMFVRDMTSAVITRKEREIRLTAEYNPRTLFIDRNRNI